jgi:hypothetical protein
MITIIVLSVLTLFFIAWMDYIYMWGFGTQWVALFSLTAIWPLFSLSTVIPFNGNKWQYHLWKEFSGTLQYLFFIFIGLGVLCALPFIAYGLVMVFSLMTFDFGEDFDTIAIRCFVLGFSSFLAQAFMVVKMEQYLESLFGEIDTFMDNWWDL